MELSKLPNELYFINNFKLAKSTLIGTITLEDYFQGLQMDISTFNLNSIKKLCISKVSWIYNIDIN